MKVSVVITTFNSQNKIEEVLKAAKKIANEIIVVDSSSSDNSLEIVKKYTNKVFKRENYLMLNRNKNFGFSKATSPWILSLDADEIIEEDLADEIIKLDENGEFDGYYIPRKNIIMGKWIKHTGWYPDHQLRLFKKSKGKFDEIHVHEMLNVDGKTGNLTGHLYHLNYDNVSQFLEKTISTYTVSEAESKIASGYEFDVSDIYRMPISEFVGRFFANKGYKDGMHGLVLSVLMAFYHFVVFLRIWEKNSYKDSSDTLSLFGDGSKYAKHEIAFWENKAKIEGESNFLRKNILRIQQKLKKK